MDGRWPLLRGRWKQDGWPAGKAFALLGVIFGIAFGLQIFWLAADQRQVLDGTERVLTTTIPSTLERFRLARNIEQLRLDGERVFSGRTPVARQQALFVVSLLSSHPALLADARTAGLATEVERFLGQAAREGMNDARYAEWATLSNRLSLLADDVAIEGVNLATDDLRQMSATMLRSRDTLAVVLLLVGFFVGGFLFLIHRHLIRPLQKMDEGLCELRAGKALTPFPETSMLEIRSVEGAISQLCDVMRENDTARRQLQHLATTDDLTGMFNRRHFMSLAEEEIRRAHRYGRPICVAMADLDFFKRINDEHGHAVGDTVLQAMSELFARTLRQSDWMCRYGGEEFAFVFPETPIDEALVLTERLRQRVAESWITLHDGSRLQTTLSLGMADASAESLEAALMRADSALYAAKEQGRNRVVVAATDPPDRLEHAADDLPSLPGETPPV